MEVYNLQTFNTSLSKKPYCSDELQLGLRIRPLEQALKYKYIQANDNYIKFLVIDCDHTNGNIYSDAGLPPPNFIVKNKENGHFHYIYALSNPIYKDYLNKAKNLSYFAKIQQIYTTLCQGDVNYINLIVKNPNNDFWQTSLINGFNSYTLDELADYVELPQKITKQKAVGEGRNCYLFDTVRQWAYKNVLFYKENGAKQSDFYNVLLSKLTNLNVFDTAPSLNYNELKAIAKSISSWTWKHFSISKFKEIQSHRAKKPRKMNDEIKEELINVFRK